jgi:hypothetical protein
MSRILWLDAYDYVVDLLQSGEDPWLQPDSIGIFCDEAIKLLRADYLLLPVAPLLKTHMGDAESDGEARADALDEAVGEGELLNAIARAMTALAASSGAGSVVPVIPGPAVIGGEDEDALDIAAMALGDVLRAITSIQSGIVGLAEPEEGGIAESGSLFRIADHAGCAIMLLGHMDNERAAYCFPASDTVSGIGKAGCQTIGITGFSNDGMPDPSTEHVRVQIAAEEAPEFVLKRLSSLRAMEA